MPLNCDVATINRSARFGEENGVQPSCEVTMLNCPRQWALSFAVSTVQRAMLLAHIPTFGLRGAIRQEKRRLIISERYKTVRSFTD